jgi:hypothetical protein
MPDFLVTIESSGKWDRQAPSDCREYSEGWLLRTNPAVRPKENNYSTVMETGVLYTFPQLSQACMTVL